MKHCSKLRDNFNLLHVMWFSEKKWLTLTHVDTWSLVGVGVWGGYGNSKSLTVARFSLAGGSTQLGMGFDSS